MSTPAEEYKRKTWAAEEGPQFVCATDYVRLPPPEHIIEGLAVCGGITVLAGESSSGKGFITVSAAAALGEGRSWMARRTRPRSVAYLAFEADALQLRLRAVEEQGAKIENIHALRCSEALSPVVNRDGQEFPSRGEEIVTNRLVHLAAQLDAESRPPLGLVVVDTARSSMSGSEDSSEAVAPFLRACRRIGLAAAPQAASWVIHHAGWQDGETKRKRERGSSAWRGLVEVTLYVEVESESDHGAEARLVLRTLKARDSTCGRPLRLVRRRVEIAGLDQWGDPLTSCVITPDLTTSADREAEVEQARAETQAKAEADLDRRALEIIGKFIITSQDQLRSYLGVRRDLVAPLVARLLASGRVTKAGHLAPFRLADPHAVV